MWAQGASPEQISLPRVTPSLLLTLVMGFGGELLLQEGSDAREPLHSLNKEAPPGPHQPHLSFGFEQLFPQRAADFAHWPRLWLEHVLLVTWETRARSGEGRGLTVS